MTDELKNDLFYLCSLIEYTARVTKNRRAIIISCLGEDGVRKQLKDAGVNHCLSFEQVSDEIIAWYHIPNGDFDTISTCKYTVPGYMDIGRLYSMMILDCVSEFSFDAIVKETMKVFTSFISDSISNFNSDLYYQNPSYLEWSYREGRLLD